jgi:predicted nucleic acid-binding protein
MAAVRTHYLDASAIVKLFVDEENSDILREYYNAHSTYSTTSLCFSEAIGVLKVKWLYRKEITHEQYLDAMNDLMACFAYEAIRIDEIEIKDRAVFKEVERLSECYALDISDAFQIYTLKTGFFSILTGDSKPILITGDTNLAAATRKEGLRVWDCMKEPAP